MGILFKSACMDAAVSALTELPVFSEVVGAFADLWLIQNQTPAAITMIITMVQIAVLVMVLLLVGGRSRSGGSRFSRRIS